MIIRSTLILLIALLCATPSGAQRTKVVLSDPFDELTDGEGHVLQLTNGRTFVVYSTGVKINIRVYDSAHRSVSDKTIDGSAFDTRKAGKLINVFEINNEVVLFVVNDNTLYRISLNNENGNGISKVQVMSGGGYYQILKDPGADNYMIMNAISGADDSRYTFYSGEHRQLSTATYPGASKFDDVNMVGVCLTDKWLMVATYGYYKKKEASGKNQLILSRLKPGETDFSQEHMDCAADLSETKGTLKYNPGSNRLQLLTIAPVATKEKFFTSKTTTYYAPLLSYYDPEKLELTKVKVLEGKKTDEYFKTQLGIEKGFAGVPRNMYINDDYSTTIISAETRRLSSSTSERTYLDNVGTLDLNREGEETGGAGVIMSQVMNTTSNFTSPWVGDLSYQENEYYFYDYLDTDAGRYLLVNDLEENLEHYTKRRPAAVADPAKAQTVCHSLRERKNYLLYGSEDRRFIYTNLKASTYKKSTKTYATLVTERNGRDRMSRVVWVNFE